MVIGWNQEQILFALFMSKVKTRDCLNELVCYILVFLSISFQHQVKFPSRTTETLQHSPPSLPLSFRPSLPLSLSRFCMKGAFCSPSPAVFTPPADIISWQTQLLSSPPPFSPLSLTHIEIDSHLFDHHLPRQLIASLPGSLIRLLLKVPREVSAMCCSTRRGQQMAAALLSGPSWRCPWSSNHLSL